MKRGLIVLTVICMMSISVSHAQIMKKDMGLFNVGLGLVPGFGINASYDYGLVDEWGPGVFTIGGYVGFGTWGKTYRATSHHDNYRANAFAFAPRATYRYAINPLFEVYGVVMLGGVAYSYSAYHGNGSNVFFSITGGCRYSFGKNIAAFAEMGFNEISFLTGGLAFSF